MQQCFEHLSNFIHNEESTHHTQDHRYVYEYFRPNVRNVLLEGLSREDKETTDRLKAFLERVVHSEEGNPKSTKTGFNLGVRKGDPNGKQVIQDGDDDSDGEEESSRVMPADAKPLISRVKSQAN